MSSKLKKEIERIIEIISLHPSGVSLEELLSFLDNPPPKRTLQYRLATCLKSGVLNKEGIGRNSRYFVPKHPLDDIKTVENAKTLQTAFTIPFSQEGLELRKQMLLPTQQRQHVSYQRAFLEAYQPNSTSYLSPAIIEKLTKLGAGAEKGHPAGTYARKIYQRLLIDLSWNSSRLEGNTYSLLETERLLATGEEASGKNPMDTQMLLNHKAAIEFIVEMAEEVDINRYTILNIHGLLSQDLLMDPQACGRLRTIPVKIGKSVYHPVEMPQLIEEYFQIIIQKANAIKNPFEQSFFLMVHLPYLQPFLDVNKRVSRLAGNIPFIRENLSPLSFVDVPESDYVQGLLAIYELNRIELFRDVFVWAYERSASLYLATLEAIGPPDPFRTHYRDLIRQAVYTVVYNKMDKLTSAQYISTFAKENISAQDVSRFIEVTEIEVSSLHEGNFARFKIRPSEFFEWHRLWR
jgi:hypothetical protein